MYTISARTRIGNHCQQPYLFVCNRLNFTGICFIQFPYNGFTVALLSPEFSIVPPAAVAAALLLRFWQKMNRNAKLFNPVRDQLDESQLDC